ncbi:MAG: hypothetical protein FWB85_11395 [Chitinispirillia bacterium]|nr:hypothetical protein [Chitinispirillia bacterium]
MYSKFKKAAAAIISALLTAAPIFADNHFFPTAKGAVQLTANLNEKGKVEGYNRMTVRDVKGSGGDMTVVYAVEVLDKHHKPIGKSGAREYSVKIAGGVLEFELKNMMDAFFAAKGMTYELTAGKLRIPSNMAAGTKIADTWMNMTVKVPIIGEVIADVKMTDMRCTGVETVTVPAGTFEACKVVSTSTTNTKGWGKPVIVNKGTTWYVKGVGAVKSVNIDEKGKVESSTELRELVK